MKILAHRGHWRGVPALKNSAEAIEDAFSRGWGVETDLRDLAGEVVVSHDMPVAPQWTLHDLLAALEAAPASVVLALNVKADGLAAPVAARLGRMADRAFAFDMSVPDHLAWLAAGVPVFSRWSDIERQPVLLGESAGVWLDSMRTPGWWTSADLLAQLEQRAVALVSPELHGRDHRDEWAALRRSGAHDHPDFLICTDYPLEAEGFFA